MNRLHRFLSPATLGLLLALGTVGCASLGLGTGGGEPEGPGREIRPEAPPEYDVLVFHQHIAEGRPAEATAALERAIAKDPDSAYLQRLVAEMLARNSELDRAVEHARRARELDPEDPELRNFLAQLYRIQQDKESAEGLLRDESGAPRDAQSAWLLYQLYLEVGDLDAGLATAEWMTESDPEDLRGWIALANVLEKLGRPVEAEAALRRSLEVDPDNLRVYGALARSMRQRGDREGAIGVYREMLAQAPDDHSTLLALAEVQINDEDVDGAIQTLERVEASYPNDIESVERLGYLLYEARRFEEAVERFDRVLTLLPREYEVAFFDGVALRRLGREGEAIAAFERVPAHHDYYAESRTQLAAIYERRGDYERALADVQRANETEPSRELELYTATLRAKIGDLDGAVAYLEAMLEKEPENDEILYNLGVVYGEADQDEQAIATMRRVLEVNPENADALNYIGYSWAEQGENLEQAEEYIQRAIELRPDNGYIVDSLGWVYYMRARPLIEAGDLAAGRKWLNKAIEKLEHALELTGGDPVISEHIGDAYLLLDERERALENFEEAALMGPRSDEQPELRQKLESLRREFE